MERRKLSAEEVVEKLDELDGWTAEDDKLVKRFEFENFAAALDFINRAGDIAEKSDHHPDICFGWGFAEFSITTHDRGGITNFDFALAQKIDDISIS